MAWYDLVPPTICNGENRGLNPTINFQNQNKRQSEKDHPPNVNMEHRTRGRILALTVTLIFLFPGCFGSNEEIIDSIDWAEGFGYIDDPAGFTGEDRIRPFNVSNPDPALNESWGNTSWAVFGNPERAQGGIHWVIVGSSFLLLVWLYYSWDIAKSFFPKSANELCQVGKVDESLLSLKYLFPIEERQLKSTSVIETETKNLDKIILLIEKSNDVENQNKNKHKRCKWCKIAKKRSGNICILCGKF